MVIGCASALRGQFPAVFVASLLLSSTFACKPGWSLAASTMIALVPTRDPLFMAGVVLREPMESLRRVSGPPVHVVTVLVGSTLTRAGSLRCVRRPCPGAGVVSAMRLAGCVCSRAALGPFWRCRVHRSRPQRKRSAHALLLRCGEPLALPRRVGCCRLARPRDYSASRDWLLSVCW